MSYYHRFNVVFVMCDDMPIDGFDTTYMPWLTAKSDGNWVEFTNSMWQHPLCGPCRATVLTGLSNRHARMFTNNELFDESKSLPIILQRAGYVTGLFGKYINGWPFPTNAYVPRGWSRFFGNDGRGYLNYDVWDQRAIVSYGSTDADYSTDVFFGKAVDFINNIATRSPFFCYVTPYTPHETSGAITPATRHAGLYPGAIPARRGNFNEADISDKPTWFTASHPGGQLSQGSIDAMDEDHMNGLRAMRAVDEGIEDIRDALNTKGILDRTVIIVTNDNGNSYGEHREDGKDFPWEEQVRVKTLIRFPQATQAVKTELMSSLDLAPTIAEIAGVKLMNTPDGMSLVPLLTGVSTNWRSHLFSESLSGTQSPHWRSIRDSQYKYIEYGGVGTQGTLSGEDQSELYDLTNDPYELVNQTNNSSFSATKNSLSSKLTVLKSEFSDSVAVNHLTTNGSNVDQSLYTTDSITPTAYSLVLLWVFCGMTGAQPSQPTVTGNGLTWSHVNSLTSSTRRLSLFYTMGSVPTVGAVTINYGVDAIIGAVWSISEITNAIGAEAADAVIKNDTYGPTSTTDIELDLTSLQYSGNIVIGGFANTAASQISVATNTELGHIEQASPNLALATAYNRDNLPIQNGTYATSGSGFGIGVEVRAL